MADSIPSVHLHGGSFKILFQRYANRCLCISLVDEEGPYACATVNVPEVAGVVEDTEREVPTGYATANVVRLKVPTPDFDG